MYAANRIAKFRKCLLVWAEQNMQQYPWRFLNDPYAILVAEFMLHRTQTRQVQPIFEKFIGEYPTLSDYAQADSDRVAALLHSLGLHWRTQAMMNALSEMWRTYGEVPVDYEKLTSIRGIGQYIAGATICFSRNERITLIDSNIVRVVGRVFGLNLAGEARRKRSVIAAITEVCDPVQPRTFYYALIDLAHSICTPQRPDCQRCPLLEVPCAYGTYRTSGDDREPQPPNS
jgi:A/G-specific adenine glycosylase